MDSRTGFIDVNGSGLDLIYLYEPRTSGPAGITTYISQTYSQDLGSIFYMNANLGGLGLTGATGTNCGYKNSFGIDLGSMFCAKGTVAPLVTVFTPLSASGCSLWLDAADATTLFTNANGTGAVTGTTTGVKYWKNKAGSSNNATWTTNAAGVNYTAGAYPSLTFTSSRNSDYTISINGVSDMFVIASYPDGTVFTNNGYYRGMIGSMGPNYMYTVPGTTAINGSGNPPTIMYNGGAVAPASVQTLNMFALVGGSGSLNIASACIGKGGNYEWLGTINEMLIYTSLVSASDRINIEGYLAKKWGLQSLLPSTHPYYNSLVFYYPFNTGDIVSGKLANYATGTAVYDASVSNGTGAVLPTIDTVINKFGTGSMNFPGGAIGATTGGYLKLPSFTNDLNGISFCCWVQATSADNSSVYTRIFDFSNSTMGVNANVNSLNLSTKSGFYLNEASSGFLTTTDLTGPSFKFVVVTIQYLNKTGANGEVKMYINGTISGTDSAYYYPGVMTRTLNVLGVSTYTSEYPLKGKMDEFRMYKRVLNSTEVSNLYTANDPGPQLGLLPFLPTGCVGLYACKWVNNGYSGPILKLRKSSDTGGTSMLDFYIDKTGVVVTTGVNGTGTSFATWIGTDTAYVYTWYDQSGRGNHATQTSNTILQPTFILTGGVYNIFFPVSSGAYLSNSTSILGTGKPSHTIIFRVTDTTILKANLNHVFSVGPELSNQEIVAGLANNFSTKYGLYYDFGATDLETSTVSILPKVVVGSFDYDGTTRNLYFNKSSTATVSNSANPALAIPAGYNSNIGYSTTTAGRQFQGSLSFMSVFNNVLSTTNRQIIENVDEFVWNGNFSQSITTPQAVSSTSYVNNWTVSSISTFFLATTADATYTRGGSTGSPFVALPSGTTQFLVSNLAAANTPHNIKQSVNIPAAGIYTLTFYHNGRSGATNPYVTTHTLTVGLASKTVVSALSTTNSGWQLFTGSLALSSTDVGYKDLTLTFNNSAATNSSYYITGVVLNYVGPAVGTGLLATVPTGSVGLFACKWVNNNYVGPILRLRKSTDTTGASLQDFFMDSTGYQIGTMPNGTGTSFATWLGAATAFVDTWYDQSGQFKHAVQSATAKQPLFSTTALDSTKYYVDFSNLLATTGADSRFMTLPNGTLPSPNYPNLTITFRHYTTNTITGNMFQYNTNQQNYPEMFRAGTDVGTNTFIIRADGTANYRAIYGAPDSWGYNVPFSPADINTSTLKITNTGSGSITNDFYSNRAGNFYSYNNTLSLTGKGTGWDNTNFRISGTYPLNSPIYNFTIFNTALNDSDRITMEQIDSIVWNGYFTQNTITGDSQLVTDLTNWTESSATTFYIAKTTDTLTYTRGTSTTSPYVALPTGVSQFLVSRLTTTNVAVSHNIIQSVNIPAVGIYTLTFYHAGRTGTNTYSTNHTLAVDIGTQNVVSALQTTTSATASSVGWQLFTGSVAITSAGTKDLKFTFTNSSTSATDSSYYITGVVLNYVGPAVIPTTSLVFSLTFGTSTVPTKDLTGVYNLIKITNASYPLTPAMVLDGTRGYVLATEIGTGLTTDFFPNTASFSRCFWLKKNATGQGNTLTSPRYPIYVSTGNKLQIDLNYGGSPITTVLDTTDRGQVWVHYVFTYDSTSKICILYVNGNAVANGTTAPISAENLTLCIGNFNTSSKTFGGNQYFDNIYCYSRALTSTEVLLIYFNGTTNL